MSDHNNANVLAPEADQEALAPEAGQEDAEPARVDRNEFLAMALTVQHVKDSKDRRLDDLARKRDPPAPDEDDELDELDDELGPPVPHPDGHPRAYHRYLGRLARRARLAEEAREYQEALDALMRNNRHLSFDQAVLIGQRLVYRKHEKTTLERQVDDGLEPGVRQYFDLTTDFAFTDNNGRITIHIVSEATVVVYDKVTLQVHRGLSWKLTENKDSIFRMDHSNQSDLYRQYSLYYLVHHRLPKVVEELYSKCINREKAAFLELNPLSATPVKDFKAEVKDKMSTNNYQIDQVLMSPPVPVEEEEEEEQALDEILQAPVEEESFFDAAGSLADPVAANDDDHLHGLQDLDGGVDEVDDRARLNFGPGELDQALHSLRMANAAQGSVDSLE